MPMVTLDPKTSAPKRDAAAPATPSPMANPARRFTVRSLLETLAKFVYGLLTNPFPK
jgi:hypothetical protein